MRCKNCGRHIERGPVWSVGWVHLTDSGVGGFQRCRPAEAGVDGVQAEPVEVQR